MKFNKLDFKKITCSEFIKTHTHIRYCEAIIYPDGDITYAVRSHLEALMKITGKSQEYIHKTMDANVLPLEWLVEYTGCVCVWFNFIIKPQKDITLEQAATLNELKNHKIILN